MGQECRAAVTEGKFGHSDYVLDRNGRRCRFARPWIMGIRRHSHLILRATTLSRPLAEEFLTMVGRTAYTGALCWWEGEVNIFAEFCRVYGAGLSEEVFWVNRGKVIYEAVFHSNIGRIRWLSRSRQDGDAIRGSEESNPVKQLLSTTWGKFTVYRK